MSNWTQPVCRWCWDFRQTALPPERRRESVRVVGDEQHYCCNCSAVTTDGIWLRIDPTTVRYPEVCND